MGRMRFALDGVEGGWVVGCGFGNRLELPSALEDYGRFHGVREEKWFGAWIVLVPLCSWYQ